MFEDATSPHILLSYATSERLGIIAFNIPNMAATSQVDNIAMSTSPSQGSVRKTTKTFTFWDPLVEPASHFAVPQPHPPQQQEEDHFPQGKLHYSSLHQWLKAQNPLSTTITHTIKAILVHCLHPTPKAQLPKATSPCTTAQVLDLMALKQAFPNSFNTIGNMPRTYTIRTNPSVSPIQHAQQKVPIEYWEQIECTLDDMITKGVIASVSQLTEWVSLLTYPHKVDGFLHICLNPKDRNKAIVQEYYKVPTLDEISHHLGGATCFSKLNDKDGFWSIYLDENSSYLTTFNMHHGRYRFLYMPFSLKMSQDVFQMQMDQATDHLPGIITIHDDICIFGCTPEEHDEHLLCLIKTAKDHGIVFNSAKCHIRQPQIAFYGTFFTAQGMQPDPTKIQAPQSFLGLINNLQPFIPGLFAKAMFPWEQLAKLDWNPSTDAASQCLKAWICQTLLSATLAYYDRSKPVIVQTDACEYRLGATLIQSSHPIAFPVKCLLTSRLAMWTLRESVC